LQKQYLQTQRGITPIQDFDGTAFDAAFISAENVLQFCPNIFKGGTRGGRRCDKNRISRWRARAVSGGRGWELHPAGGAQCSA
jgi:hypothetical protein